MTVLARLHYNPQLILTFESYNERYEGSYPDLSFKADVRFRFTGNFRIQATNVVKLGGLSKTISRWDLNYIQDSGWYYLGQINDPMYCNRQRSFEWNVSCQGWPNLSGKVIFTTPKIELPTYEVKITDINSTSISIYGRLKTNPYNLYTLRIYSKETQKFIVDKLNGTHVVSGLKGSTNYEFHIEPFMADCSGSYLLQTVLNATTLEDYKKISVTSVDVTISHIDDKYDNAVCVAHTTDDAHVTKSCWDYDGLGDGITSNNLTKEFKVSNGNEYRMFVYVTDTLGRMSDFYYFYIIASASYREVWVFDGNNWKKGKSLVLSSDGKTFEKCRLYCDTGLQWKGAKRYGED